MAHTLNLVVQHALKGQEEVSRTISCVRSIVKHYHKYAKHTKRLKDHLLQNCQTNRKLIMDVTTRWNFTFHMMERIVQLKEAINYLSNNEGIATTLNYNE